MRVHMAMVALVIHLSISWTGLKLFTQHATPVLLIAGIFGLSGLVLWWQIRQKAQGTHKTYVTRAGLMHGLALFCPLLWLIWPQSAFSLGLSMSILLIATAFIFTTRHLLVHHPIVCLPSFARRMQYATLGSALLCCLSIPLLILATRTNHITDVTYAQTTTASQTTQDLIKQFGDKPNTKLHIRLFMGPGAQSKDRVEAYFSPLISDKVQFSTLDQAQDPVLSRRLQVRENGVITITVEGQAYTGNALRWTRKIYIGEVMTTARRQLRRLDQLVQTRLRDLTQGERTIYVVSGHGELSWKTRQSHQRLTLLHKLGEDVLTSKMATLSGAQLISSGVPKDASALLLLGPESALAPEEVRAMMMYLDAGGAMIVSIEPTLSQASAKTTALHQSLEPLFKKLGVVLGDRPIASHDQIVPLTQSRADRYTMIINDMEAAPVTKGIKQNDKMALLVSTASALEVRPDAKSKVNIIARSGPTSWLDANMNFERDQSASEMQARYKVVATSQAAWRVLITSDASMWSDMLMGRNPGNQQLFQDTIHWLYKRENLAGIANQTQDVRIVHTKRSQLAWLYGTVILVPGLVLLFGVWLTRRKRDLA